MNRILKKHELEMFCMVLWMIWKNRNLISHGENCGVADQTLQDVALWLMEYQAFQNIKPVKNKLAANLCSNNCSPPQVNTWKLNVDASVVDNMEHIAVGALIRDSTVLLWALSPRVFQADSILLLQNVLRFARDSYFARHSGLRISVVESDSISVVNMIRDGCKGGVEDPILHNIKVLMIEASGGSCCYVHRQCNKAAHTIAQFAFFIVDDLYWLEDYPEPISEFVSADMAAN